MNPSRSLSEFSFCVEPGRCHQKALETLKRMSLVNEITKWRLLSIFSKMLHSACQHGSMFSCKLRVVLMANAGRTQ